MKNKLNIILITLTAVITSACNTTSPYGMNKSTGTGAVIGASSGYILGDVLGNGKTAEGMAIGAVLGFIGGGAKEKSYRKDVYIADLSNRVNDVESREAEKARTRGQTKRNFTSTVTYDKNGNVVDKNTVETITGQRLDSEYLLP